MKGWFYFKYKGLKPDSQDRYVGDGNACPAKFVPFWDTHETIMKIIHINNIIISESPLVYIMNITNKGSADTISLWLRIMGINWLKRLPLREGNYYFPVWWWCLNGNIKQSAFKQIYYKQLSCIRGAKRRYQIDFSIGTYPRLWYRHWTWKISIEPHQFLTALIVLWGKNCLDQHDMKVEPSIPT